MRFMGNTFLLSVFFAAALLASCGDDKTSIIPIMAGAAGAPAGPPDGIAASPGDGSNSISWVPVTGATSYNIYWGTSPGVTKEDGVIVSASSPYNHVNLGNGTTYYYAVTAVNGSGESGLSSEVSAAPALTFTRIIQKARANDAQDFDYFGSSACISGDYAIVGAPQEDAGGTDAGAAYIFHRTGTDTWDAGVKIMPPDPEEYDYFGSSVAISGDYAIVGAPGEDSEDTNAGAAYVFHRTGVNTWSGAEKITSTSPHAVGSFGSSVAISGDYAIIGAPDEENTVGLYEGAVYVFHRTGTNAWGSGVQVVHPESPESCDYFGWSVSISGDYMIVGVIYDDVYGSAEGTAYIFHRTGTNAWGDWFRITATDPENGDYFGNSVSISGDYAIVGAPYEDTGGDAAGAAYIFRRIGGNSWDGGVKIVATYPESDNYFGYSVSISGDYAVVGAYGQDLGSSNRGSAYIYRREGANTWDTGTMITSSDFENGYAFGYSVSMSGDYAIVGAQADIEWGASAGAAYFMSK